MCILVRIKTLYLCLVLTRITMFSPVRCRNFNKLFLLSFIYSRRFSKIIKFHLSGEKYRFFLFLLGLACSTVLQRANSHTKRVTVSTLIETKRFRVKTSSKHIVVCLLLFYELDMRIKRVLGRIKRAVHDCC